MAGFKLNFDIKSGAFPTYVQMSLGTPSLHQTLTILAALYRNLDTCRVCNSSRLRFLVRCLK
jgi:hypothetical protein